MTEVKVNDRGKGYSRTTYEHPVVPFLETWLFL